MTRLYDEQTKLYEDQEPVWSSREGDSVSLFVGSKSIAISSDLIQDVIGHLSKLYYPEVKLMDGNPQSAEEVFELFPALDGRLGEYDVACKYCSRGIMCRDTA